MPHASYPMPSYDLIVIGSGPAGEKGAAQAAYFGRRGALLLRESALHLSGFRQRGFKAVNVNVKSNVNVADFMYRKQIVVEREWQRIDSNLRRHNIDRYTGTARFVSPHDLEVTTGIGTEKLSGEIILIATGSSPYRPSTVPFDDEFVCDSDSILRMTTMPKSLAIVGAGVIGCEYASIFAALEVEVHLIDGRTSLLPQIDSEIMRVLLADMQTQLGITLHLGCDVAEIDKCERDIAIPLKERRCIVCDKVLYAAGRSSNTARSEE